MLYVVVTVELRWFTEHAITDAQLRAFARDGAIERRVDRYLLGTPADCGIKERGAAARHARKQRLSAEPVRVPVASGELDGQLERWDKQHARELSDGEWFAVTKHRARRHHRQVYAELTSLRTGRGRAWTTFAVEVVESTRQRRDLTALVDASASLLEDLPWLADLLRDGQSCGYPGWLCAQP